MVSSQEVIERSIYSSILGVTVGLGYTVDPDTYLPINQENSARFKNDIAKLNPYIGIYGAGNNQSKGKKITPRIDVNPRGFYPGAIGLPRQLIEKEEGIGYTATEMPYETIDQYIDVHLVANSQQDIRLLHSILFYSVPQRGYIKPYTEERFLFSGNIFIELVNFFDTPNLDVGIIEKIYQFQVFDTITYEKPVDGDLTPITDISLLLQGGGYEENINIIKNNP